MFSPHLPDSEIPLPVGKRDETFIIVDPNGWQQTLDSVAALEDVILAAELMGFIVRASKVGHA